MIRILFAVLLVLSAGSSLMAQDDVAAFYQGKTMRLIVGVGVRSEEHTSELQSLRHLVCRLLLEKKADHALRGGAPLRRDLLGGEHRGGEERALLEDAGEELPSDQRDQRGSRRRRGAEDRQPRHT